MNWPLELKRLRDSVVMRMDMSVRGSGIVDATRQLTSELTADPEQVDAVMDEIFGLGPLEALLLDRRIRAIALAPPAGLQVIRDDGSAHPVERGFRDDPHVRRMIGRIMEAVGVALPAPGERAEGQLGDGSVVHAWLEAGLMGFRIERPHRP